MFCKNCGQELGNNAKFCSKCGRITSLGEVQNIEQENIVTEEKTNIDNDTVRYKLTPTFNLWYKLITITSKTVLLVFILTIYFIGDFDIMLYLIKETSSLFVFGSILIAIYIVIQLVMDKKQYDKLQYNFYANRVEYIDGFFNKEEKELKYKYIREVTMSQGIIERIFGLGTIKVFTNASSGVSNNRNHSAMINKNGITVHCVTNVKEHYNKIKLIIDECTEE